MNGTSAVRGGRAPAHGPARLTASLAQCTADFAAETAGVHLAGVAFFDHTHTLRMQAAHGYRTHTFRNLVIPDGRSIAHKVRATGRLQSLSDYATESGCPPWLIDMFCGGEGASALAAVPLRSGGTIVGVLYGGVRDSGPIGDRPLSALEMVAQLVAPSVGPPAEDVPRESPCAPPALSPRELEMVALLSRGLSTREMAAETFLTVNSVRTYIQAAICKLGCRSRLQAVAEARKWGLVS